MEGLNGNVTKFYNSSHRVKQPETSNRFWKHFPVCE